MKLKSSFILLTLGVIFMSASMKTCNKDIVLEFKAKMDPIFIDVQDTAAPTLNFLYAKEGILFKLDSTMKANSIDAAKIESIKINTCKFTMISIKGILGGTFDGFERIASHVQPNLKPLEKIDIGAVNPVLGNTSVDLIIDQTKDVLPVIKSENIDFGVAGTLRALKIDPMRIRADVELTIGYKVN